MTTSTCKESRAVSFKSVEIYEHAYELGDNPSVSNGPPLTISWEQQDVHLLDLNQYELSRDRRKSKAQFRLTNKDRAHLLLASGHSMEEIVTCALQANQVKHSRMESIRNMKWDGFNHAIETTTRTLKKVARRSSLLASVPMRRRASMLQGSSTPKGDPVARRHSMMGSVCDADANVSLARSA